MDESARNDMQAIDGRQAQEASACSTVDQSKMPQMQVANQGTCSGVAIKSGAAVASLARRARKGFGMAGTKKKRLVLKLDDNEAAAGAGVSTPKGNNNQVADPETQDRPTDGASDSVPWWKVEYQRPPPGHLGAHVVPVAQTQSASIFQQIGEVSAPNMFVKRCTKPDESSLQRSTLDDSPGARKRLHSSHETPERAHRRARGDALSAFASIPSLLVDSSPTQKRKIRHVRESETRDLLEEEGEIVVKEQKRFHEASNSTNDSRQLFARHPTVVTPSRLVKPLNEIEIASEAPTSTDNSIARAESSQQSIQADKGEGSLKL